MAKKPSFELPPSDSVRTYNGLRDWQSAPRKHLNLVASYLLKNLDMVDLRIAVGGFTFQMMLKQNIEFSRTLQQIMEGTLSVTIFENDVIITGGKFDG